MCNIEVKGNCGGGTEEEMVCVYKTAVKSVGLEVNGRFENLLDSV